MNSFGSSILLLHGYGPEIGFIVSRKIKRIDEICANAYTPEGKALCKKFEMTYLGEHTPKGSLFFRDMSSLPNTLFVNEHPDLVQMYKREYNKVP